MSREWKPGDVGVTGSMFSGEVPTRFLVCSRDGGLRFDYADGDTAHFAPRDDARPLVVIDPEDREQVERLASVHKWMGTNANVVDDLAGLGAVVEDAEGKRWVRHEHDRGRLDSRHAWYPAGYVGTSVRVTWDDITATRVLSEGVTA